MINHSKKALEAECQLVQFQSQVLSLEVGQLDLKSKGMLPRVKMNPSFTSPLFLDSKTSYIPTVAKLAFLHGFINRLRNKVSRVDLLSSGCGFVISAADLEDCINYLNKQLVLFGEREMRKKNETHLYIQEVLKSKIAYQEREIEALKLKSKQEEQNEKLTIDALVHEKGNKIIYQIGLMTRKEEDFKRFIVGLEDRIRESIKQDFINEMHRLELDKHLLQNMFTEFKTALTKLFTSLVKAAQKNISGEIKKITYYFVQSLKEHEQIEIQSIKSELEGILQSCDDIPSASNQNLLQNQTNTTQMQITSGTPINKSQQQLVQQNVQGAKKKPDGNQNQTQNKQLDKSKKSGDQLGSTSRQSIFDDQKKTSNKRLQKLSGTEELNQKSSLFSMRMNDPQQMNPDQRCAPDEDLVEDPYILNKYINKLRILYLMRIGIQNERHQTYQAQLQDRLKSFETLHDELIQVKRENNLFKTELVNLHNIIKEQDQQNKSLQKDLEILQFEKQRIEKNKDDYRKQVLGLQSRMAQSEQKYLNQRLDHSRLYTEEAEGSRSYIKVDEINKSPIFKKKIKQAIDKQVGVYKKQYNVRLRNLETQCTTEKKQVYSLQVKTKNPQLPLIQFNTTGVDDGWKDKAQELFAKNKQMENEVEQLYLIIKQFVNGIDLAPQLLESNNLLSTVFMKGKQLLQQQDIKEMDKCNTFYREKLKTSQPRKQSQNNSVIISRNKTSQQRSSIDQQEKSFYQLEYQMQTDELPQQVQESQSKVITQNNYSKEQPPNIAIQVSEELNKEKNEDIVKQ